MTDRYAVIGNPVGHSKSPWIHSRFAEQTGEALEYSRLEAPLDAFQSTATVFFTGGGKGLNVTVPFKEAAYQAAHRRSSAAELAKAVNTLWMEGSDLVADNTDGVGLVRDLTENLGQVISGRRILVIGAGGAVRGVLGPLMAQQPEALVIVNRTEARAESLAEEFRSLGPVESCSFDRLTTGFDLILNATSASLSGQLPPVPPSAFNGVGMVYDMMYAEQGTPFLHEASRLGAARVADGIGMLVEQAAESFFLWRGKRPQTAPVMRALNAWNR